METNSGKNQPMAGTSAKLEDNNPTIQCANEDSPQTLDLVPAETWVRIFEYLNQDELLKSISLVYKNWFHIVSNERKSLTIEGKKNSKKNSKNIADVQSLVSRFPNLKELILKHKIFWITKESLILPLNFSNNPYLVKVVVWTLPSIDFLQGEHCVYKLKEEDFENDEESSEKYRFAIKKTVVNRFCMNPKEKEICVDNIKPENVRHLALSLHFENCKQNDVWPEKLIKELSHLPETLKEKKMESLESIEIYYAPTMSSEWTTIPQVYINAIVNFDKFFLSILELKISSLTIGFGCLANMIEVQSNALNYSVINYHIKELKLHSWDGGSWTKDIMKRVIRSLPNLEVLAIDTASSIIDISNEEKIQNWDVLLDIVKCVSHCKKLRWLRFGLLDQLSFLPFLEKFGEWHKEQSCCDNNHDDTQDSEEVEENIKEDNIETEEAKKEEEIGYKNMENDEKEVENHDANYESSEFEDDSEDESEPDDSSEDWIENDPSNEEIGEIAQEALEIIQRTFPVEAEIEIRQFRYNDPASNNAGMKIRTIVSKEKEKIAQLGKQVPKKE